MYKWIVVWLFSLILQPMAFAEPLKLPAKILVVGDSLSAAYGIDAEKGWVSIIDNRLKVFDERNEVVNASISGETTAGGRSRLAGLLKREKPTAVILELGANDGLRGYSLNIAQRNLAAMIEISLMQNVQVYLLGIRLPPNYGPAFDEAIQSMYRALSEQYSVPLEPFLLEDVALNPKLMQADGLHPNAQAQPLIADRVIQLLLMP